MREGSIFKGLFGRQAPTPEQAERQMRRKYILGLFLIILICLLAIIFGSRGLWQAWQTGRWDDSYWVDSFLLQVLIPLISALSSSVALTLYFSQRANKDAKDQPGKPANRKISTTVIAFSPLLLIMLFAATALGLQTYEPYSYNTLLAQIQTHKPLYQHAAETFPANYYYVQGLNHIPFGTPAFQTPGIYGDSVVEVTVRLTSQEDADGQYTDSLGLLLRNYSTDTGIIFQISPDGDWSIGRHPDQSKDHNLSYLYHSSTINTAPGASNRLAVIMRDNHYICFINDQFVGIYQDSGSPTGPIGLDVETASASVAFTDFTIYPL